MRFSIIVILFCTAFISGYSQQYNANDTHLLNEVAEKWQRYWNSHNMDSFSTIFSRDIDFVTKSGGWFKGKEATMEHHKKNHATIFKSSRWATDSVVIKYIKSDVAMIHIGWGLSGDEHHDGTPSDPRHGISTWVLTKLNGRWLLSAVHNVNIEPPK
jgi:uncharacterized protein (TIGR02246 family)